MYDVKVRVSLCTPCGQYLLSNLVHLIQKRVGWLQSGSHTVESVTRDISAPSSADLEGTGASGQAGVPLSSFSVEVVALVALVVVLWQIGIDHRAFRYPDPEPCYFACFFTFGISSSSSQPSMRLRLSSRKYNLPCNILSADLDSDTYATYLTSTQATSKAER